MMSIFWTKRDTLVLIAMLSLVTAAVAVRLPGVHWLIGYGYESDYSFHPDDYRFIIYAKSFRDPLPLAKLGDGYPPFMATQLFLLDLFLHKIVHIAPNNAVVLRCISIAYGVLSIILLYVFLTFLKFSRLVCILSSFFLAFAPLHIILSHFGTADMSAFFLFYLTIFTGWRHQTSNNELWFYITVALAGITMADKFFLPVLIPPAIIIFSQQIEKIWSTSFISLCILVTFFGGASFFNYTPWDFVDLLRMLSAELVKPGGKSPLQQIILYLWDIIACSGVITSGLTFIGCILLFQRFGLSTLQRLIKRRRKEFAFSNIIKQIQIWLRWPASIIILPLLFHAVLIVTAQTHASRHIFIFVPIVCVFAAVAVETASEWLRFKSISLRVMSAVLLFGMLAIQFANGVVTDWIYPADIRAKLGDFLTERQIASKTSTFSHYTAMKGVAVTDNVTETPIFVTCDIEYRRYILAGQGIPEVHISGGKARTDFYISLLAGQANYVPIFDIKRKRLSVEDHLAENGWLPNIDTFVPNECRAFQKKGS